MEIKDSNLRRVYLIGFFLILALPLLNLPPWFSPPDWGKIIFFRIALSILIFFFVWQILYQKNRLSVIQRRFQRVSASSVFWLLLSLFGIFLLATIFSLDRNFSLWGSPYRAGGFINFAFYIIFAILTFLILRKSDWQKIWNFAIIIGVLVSLIAIFQQFGLFSKIFVSFAWRAPSTIGGPSFLAIYLLLLSFLTLSFGIKGKKYLKKIFYFLTFLLFLFVIIFITKTRAAYIGLAAGFLWLLFFYPKKLVLFKILAAVFLVLAIFGFYFLKTHPEISLFEKKSLPQIIVNRVLNISFSVEMSRVSAWRISFQALQNRPILGYGPENFSIGFDKYYDPSLPGMRKGTYYQPSSWWDKAHNFIFDIGVTAGIPALIIYLSLFGVLFFQLQKLKKRPEASPVLLHGIQTTFLAYLVANLFSFDAFSSYIILFSLFGFSLHLINTDTNLRTEQKLTNKKIQKPGLWRLQEYRGAVISVLFICLIWFIWNYNLKPLQINTEINLALYELKEGYCERALARLEKISPTHSFLDNYLRLKYVDIIEECIKKKPELTGSLAPKATEILKENIKIRTYYTRNWLLLGGYTNVLIEKNPRPELAEGLKDEANYYFERAFELSPKRQEIFIEWIKADLLTKEYQKAKEKSQKCIGLNEKIGDCWWYLSLSNLYLGEKNKAKENIEIASQKGYSINSKPSLLQLAKVYGELKDYQELVKIYPKIIAKDPANAQYHASLAFVYKELGDIENARAEALKVLELMPEAKEDVEKFLRELE